MSDTRPADIAQRLYDQAEINYLDEDIQKLDQWAGQLFVLDALVDKSIISFANVGVGKGRALWMVMSKHRPDLLVPLLDKIADQGMLAPKNVVRTHTLIDPQVRRHLLNWLVHGPDPDPTLGMLELKEMAVGVLEGQTFYEDSQAWMEPMADMARIVSDEQRTELILWLTGIYHSRIMINGLKGPIEVMDEAFKDILEATIQAGLDVEKELTWTSPATTKLTPAEVQHISLIHALAHEYFRHDCQGPAMVAAAVDLGADWRRVLNDPKAQDTAKQGLLQHPVVRKHLLEEQIVSNAENGHPRPRQKL